MAYAERPPKPPAKKINKSTVFHDATPTMANSQLDKFFGENRNIEIIHVQVLTWPNTWETSIFLLYSEEERQQ